MSARLVLAGRLGLDPARGLNREPKALSQSVFAALVKDGAVK
jgi:hypothetical protein